MLGPVGAKGIESRGTTEAKAVAFSRPSGTATERRALPSTEVPGYFQLPPCGARARRRTEDCRCFWHWPDRLPRTSNCFERNGNAHSASLTWVYLSPAGLNRARGSSRAASPAFIDCKLVSHRLVRHGMERCVTCSARMSCGSGSGVKAAMRHGSRGPTGEHAFGVSSAGCR